MAFALDVGGVATFASAPLVGGDLDTDIQAWRYLILAGVVPPFAALAALAASIRSVREAKTSLAKLLASALAVVSGIMLLLGGVLLLVILQGSP